MDKEAFFATAALMVGPPPIDRSGIAFGTMVGSKASSPRYTGFERFGFGIQLLTLWEKMGRPGTDTNWIRLASHPITSNERKDLSEVIYKEYVKWYETEQKIKLAAEAL